MFILNANTQIVNVDIVRRLTFEITVNNLAGGYIGEHWRTTLESMTCGWVKSSVSGTYHYIARINDNGTRRGECGYSTRHYLYFYKKFEILDKSKICVKCELIITNRAINTAKKRDFIYNMEPIIHVQDTHTLKQVTCSDPECNESGVAYVSTTRNEKEHYCIEHNLRIQMEKIA